MAVGAGALGGLGSVLEQRLRGEAGIDIKEAGIEAALSAVGGPVGKGVSIVGSKLLPKITGGIATKLMGGVYKEPIKATKAALAKGSSLGKEALERGQVGTTEQLYKKAVQGIDDAESAIQQTLLGSGKTVNIKDIEKTVAPLVKEYMQAGNTRAANAITSRITAIKAQNGTQIPAHIANQIKRSLYNEAQNAYGTEASANMEGIKAIARGLKESLGKIAGVGDLNKDLSFFGRARNSMLDKMSREQRNNFIGLGDAILGAGGFAAAGPAGLLPALMVKGAGSTVGRTVGAQALSKAGGAISKIGESNILPALGAGVGAGAGLSLTPSESQPNYTNQEQSAQSDFQTLPPLTGNISQTGGKSQIPGQLPAMEQPYLTGYSPEDLYKGYQKAISKGDKKSAEILAKWFEDETAYQETQRGEDKSIETRKIESVAVTGARSLQNIKQLFAEDPDVLTKQLVPGKFFTREFDAELYNMVDSYLKLRTGATSNENEIRGYMDRIAPRFGDSPQVVQQKLQIFEDAFNEYLGGGTTLPANMYAQ